MKSKGGSWYAQHRKIQIERERTKKQTLLIGVVWGMFALIVGTEAMYVLPAAAEAHVDIVSQNIKINDILWTFDEPTSESIEDMIVRLAGEYGVSAERSLAIAKCESNFNAGATNWEGSTASGVFQWTLPTWKHIGSPGDRFNAEDNIRAFMRFYPQHPGWWECSKILYGNK